MSLAPCSFCEGGGGVLQGANEKRRKNEMPSLLYVVQSSLECKYKYRGQIHSPWLGDIVDTGIGLLYRSANIFILAGQPYAMQSTISPQSGTMNLALVL
jgi:hypothetical protein